MIRAALQPYIKSLVPAGFGLALVALARPLAVPKLTDMGLALLGAAVAVFVVPNGADVHEHEGVPDTPERAGEQLDAGEVETA